MTAYMIAELSIKDTAAFAEYAKAVRPIIEKYGGRVIVRSDAAMPLEGEAPRHFVLIQFNSMDDAKRFYGSEEYRAPLQKRLSGIATGRVFLADGA
jgi:uncharacterized protein (DUF1330 family)